MGSGHSVTALYELIPNGLESKYLKQVDELKYQKTSPLQNNSDEVLTIKLRYKKPDSETSKLFQTSVSNKPIAFQKASADFRFAAAVAEWGLLLRNSDFKGNANHEQIIEIAQKALSYDPEGYRSEFIRLVKLSKSLDTTIAKKED